MTAPVQTKKPAVVVALGGAAGMIFVGGSVAVSGELAGAPVLTVQALRYGVACLLLLGYARFAGVPVNRPRGTEWAWLLGVVLSGLVLFNIALVDGSRHAEPAVLGVAVACVPVLLALRDFTPRLLLAAIVVTGGAILVQGLGRTDHVGLVWAFVTFACEAAFTLLAVPVLGRLGPIGVSVHATWMAAVILGLGGVVHENSLRLDAREILADAYLAVLVTAVAFVLWYTCVTRLGTARAGLLTGIAPISAAATGVLLGGPMPSVSVCAGIGLVAAGILLGLRPDGGGRG